MSRLGDDIHSVEPPSDLTAIVTLSRVCEKMQLDVDDYYRQVCKQTLHPAYNPLVSTLPFSFLLFSSPFFFYVLVTPFSSSSIFVVALVHFVLC